MIPRLITTLVLLPFLVLIHNAAFAQKEYVLGRAPQLSASVTSKIWTPFVEFLSKQTGNRLSLKVYSDRADFENDLKNGKLDFYYGNPGYAVVGHEKFGYTPLIRSGSKQLKGILITHRESGITSLDQLRGMVISFPGENAFASSRYLRARMTHDLKLEFRPKYLSAHDDVYRSVLIGKYAAGGGVYSTLEREPEALKSQMKVLYETPGLAAHPLMAHPRVPATLQTAIQKAIIDLVDSKTGKELLRQVKIQKPVIADYQKDYASVNKLAHEMYAHLY